jgi:ABC-2 type transport system ATP-binding protein
MPDAPRAPHDGQGPHAPHANGGTASTRATGDTPTAPDTPAVSVDRLTRRFGDFTAVDAVTFDVAPGEIFGFLGPNGAGKTTTIKMLTGLLAPSEGEGRVAGLDITRERGGIRRRIGYMSQRFSLYPDLTVRENIDLFGGLYGVRGPALDERRRWILDMAELGDMPERLTAELPLGWKQRLALGCALIHQPPILFLDEPTSGVDPMARRRFWDLIDDLSAGGTTIFVSTHYMEEAEYCHRLALMNRGRLIALDTPDALRREMAVRGDADVAADADLAAHADVAADADFAAPADAAADARAETDALELPSLEDVFIELVRREGGAVEG